MVSPGGGIIGTAQDRVKVMTREFVGRLAGCCAVLVVLVSVGHGSAPFVSARHFVYCRYSMPQKICQACSKELPDHSRFCTRCGQPVRLLRRSTAQPKTDDMNLSILYTMVGGLIIALLFPPWETAPGQAPEFLGFHFILNPPRSEQDVGVISRLLLSIELVTIAVAGMYFAWLFRRK